MFASRRAGGGYGHCSLALRLAQPRAGHTAGAECHTWSFHTQAIKTQALTGSLSMGVEGMRPWGGQIRMHLFAVTLFLFGGYRRNLPFWSTNSRNRTLHSKASGLTEKPSTPPTKAGTCRSRRTPLDIFMPKGQELKISIYNLAPTGPVKQRRNQCPKANRRAKKEEGSS